MQFKAFSNLFYDVIFDPKVFNEYVKTSFLPKQVGKQLFTKQVKVLDG